MLHGDEGTFREMLRAKRTMAAVARDGAGARCATGTGGGMVEQGLRRCAGQRLDGARQSKRIRLV